MKKKQWVKKVTCFILAAFMLCLPVGKNVRQTDTVYAVGVNATKVMSTYINVGDTQTCTTYDITGNGKEDTLKISVKEDRLQIYLNGKSVYSKKADISETVNVSLYKGSEKTPMLAVGTDYYSKLFGVLLQYKNGKLKQLVNADTKLGYPRMTELKISSKRIIVPYENDWCTGTSTFNYTYTKQNGKWTVSKNGTFIGIGTAATFSVIKKFSAYQTISLKKKTFTVKPGATVNVKKCRVYKGKSYVQFEYKGKTGWILDKGTATGILDVKYAG